MKYLFVSILFLIFVVKLFNQPAKDNTLSKVHYLNKSKHQKTTAWILVCGAAVATVAAILQEDSTHILFGNTEKK